MRLAAILLAIYSVAVLANGLFYLAWSHDDSEMGRMAVRVLGVGFLSWAVFQRKKWAWVLGLVVSGLLAMAGIVGFGLGIAMGMLSARPYPGVDALLMTVMVAVLVAAFVVLWLPATRAELS